MTYFGPHERTVVQGDNQCACGRDWPCEFSAEGKLAALRTWLETKASLAAYAWREDEAGWCREALNEMDNLDAAESRQ
jgi:hypothetical protein